MILGRSGGGETPSSSQQSQQSQSQGSTSGGAPADDRILQPMEMASFIACSTYGTTRYIQRRHIEQTNTHTALRRHGLFRELVRGCILSVDLTIHSYRSKMRSDQHR